jgi:hypothetical protein
MLMRLRTIYDQLTDDERLAYDVLQLRSRVETYPDEWDRTARAYLLVDQLSRGELHDQLGIYLDDRDYEVFTASRAAGLRF